jgi:hypothetical protein
MSPSELKDKSRFHCNNLKMLAMSSKRLIREGKFDDAIRDVNAAHHALNVVAGCLGNLIGSRPVKEEVK